MAATKGTIALFGATGNTGKHFLPAALEAGFTVKALVRNPAKVSIENAALTLVKGDLSSEEDIGSLIQGADIVVCLANVPRGTKKGSTMDGWMTRVMTTIVEQMKRHSVKRLLFQCGAFTRLEGEANPNCCVACLIKDCLLGWCLGEALILKENQIIADMLQSESASIDWTLARPGILSEGESKGVVEGSYDKDPGVDVRFADLAKWEVGLILRDDAIHKGAYPGYGMAAGDSGTGNSTVV